MRVTPLDIRKQEFRKVMRGLDAEEVYAFMQTVADEYEAVLSDNRSLRERLVELEDRLKEYKNIETNLRNTLLTAEKITAEAKENARREASLIVREAEVEAEKAAEAIRAHTMQLRREILELKKQKDNYITRLKTLLDSHRKVLEGFEEDFSEVDREIEKIGEQVEMDIKEAITPTRMSRKKITEDTAVGPKDKVTWGDERRREDEPRPSMPKPGWQGKDDPDRYTGRPEDKAGSPADKEARTPSASTAGRAPTAAATGRSPSAAMATQSPTASTAAWSPSYNEHTDAERHTDAEPAVAFDRMDRSRTEDGDHETEPRGGSETVLNDAGDNGEARRIVEQSIAENLYPEAPVNEPRRQGPKADESGAPGRGSGGSQQVRPHDTAPSHRTPRMGGAQRPNSETTVSSVATEEYQAEHPGVSTAVAEAPVEESRPETETQAAQDAPQRVELKQTQDDWKHYEVRDKKPDWSSYEIPRSGFVESHAKQPTDSEVEKALAGLEDISSGGQAPAWGPRQDAKDMKPHAAPKAGQVPRQDVKDEELSTAAPQKPRDSQPEAPSRPEHAPPGNEGRQAHVEEKEDAAPRGEEPGQEARENENNGKKNSMWSMEQLRRNLSNFIGREGERAREQAEEQS